MSVATYIVIGLQVILSLILIIVVLFQSGNQRGLSGSIAGGAETFFGKNKGRTIDAKLKKWTAIVAVLFLASSIALSLLIQNDNAKKAADSQSNAVQQVEDVQNNAGTDGTAGVEGTADGAQGSTADDAQNAENADDAQQTDNNENSDNQQAENADANSEKAE